MNAHTSSDGVIGIGQSGASFSCLTKAVSSAVSQTIAHAHGPSNIHTTTYSRDEPEHSHYEGGGEARV